MGTFNFLDESEEENQMPEYPKLSVGDTVYVVSRAEAREYIVAGSFILHEPLRRSYNLDDAHDRSLHTVVPESALGQTYFLDKFEAQEKTSEYISTHDVWLSSDIGIKESKCWEYFRELDGKTLYAWYILVPDTGILITKGAYTFIHAVDFGSEQNARKHLNSVFIPSIEYIETWDGKKIPYYTESDKCNIEMKNLYPCKKSVHTLNPLTKDPEWDWSEDGYSKIADEMTKVEQAKREIEELEIA